MKKTVKRLLTSALAAITLITSLTFTGCAKTKYKDFSFFAMDTYITLRLSTASKNGGKLEESELSRIAKEASAVISEIDGIISYHDEKSDLYALNSGVSIMLKTNEKLLAMLDTAKNISSLTSGAYDYTLGPVSELWNIKGGGPVPSDDAIKEALSHTGENKIEISGDTIKKLDKAAKIDFGGIGKGMATQELLMYLSTTDVKYGIVSVGGNVGVFGENPDFGNYKLGLRDPNDENGIIGHLYIKSGFVSVSGDYERFFESDGVRYHHIIDPKTGKPADSGVRSVAVYSSNGSAADALSTALFVLGVEESIKLYNEGNLGFEAIFITTGGEIITTPGIDSDMFEVTNSAYKYTSPESEEN